MKRVLVRTFIVAAVAGLLLLAGAAEAQSRHQRRRWVPEFDPATAGAIVTLLVGGGVLIAHRGRR